MNDFSDLVPFGQAMSEVPLGGECSLNGVAYRKVVFNGNGSALPCDVCPLDEFDRAELLVARATRSAVSLGASGDPTRTPATSSSAKTTPAASSGSLSYPCSL